ncbi:hypothetical protein NPIL_566001 [Nephila pilipes]|uniref:Uncharacterized protein n=1 Tax=Nephila pilipes TaxID=299642 RepID=A0A8X6UXI6_NEPPI|nr:hypothetical protein NPIL_566001 [Nephila pilipes]
MNSWMNEPQSPSLSCSSPGEWQFLKIAWMSLGLPIVWPDRAIIAPKGTSAVSEDQWQLTDNWWSTSTEPLSVALSVIHPSLPGRKEQSNGRQMWRQADSVNIPTTLPMLHQQTTEALSADANRSYTGWLFLGKSQGITQRDIGCRSEMDLKGECLGNPGL